MSTGIESTRANPASTGIRLTSLAVVVALFLSAMDSTVVSVLLPVIGKALGRAELYPWLMSGFLASVTLVAPVSGALADRFGSPRMLQIGIGVFLCASIGAAVSASMWGMIVARIAQGIGGGMIIVLSYTLLGTVFGPNRRGQMQGMLSAVWGLAAILGPVIGVGISALLDWRYVFWFNIPLGLFCIGALATTFREFAPVRNDAKHRVDIISHVMFAVTLVCGLLILSQQSLRLTFTSTAVLAGGMLAAFGALALRVGFRMGTSPVPTTFLKKGDLFASVVLIIGSSTGLYGTVTILPQYLQQTGMGNEGMSGVVVTIAALGWVVGSAIAGSVLRRFGFRIIALLGTLMLLLGAVALVADTAVPSLFTVIAAEALTGGGIGFVATTTLVLAQNRAGAGSVGNYTAAVQLLRNLGAAAGINALAALQLAYSSSDAISYRAAFLFLVVLMLVCVPFSLMLPGDYLKQREYGV